jgi:hypothetical protein
MKTRKANLASFSGSAAIGMATAASSTETFNSKLPKDE